MKTKRRIAISVILTLALVFTMMPATANAAPEPPADVQKIMKILNDNGISAIVNDVVGYDNNGNISTINFSDLPIKGEIDLSDFPGLLSVDCDNTQIEGINFSDTYTLNYCRAYNSQLKKVISAQGKTLELVSQGRGKVCINWYAGYDNDENNNNEEYAYVFLSPETNHKLIGFDGWDESEYTYPGSPGTFHQNEYAYSMNQSYYKKVNVYFTESMGDAKITLKDVIYTGKTIKQKPVIVYNGTTLAEGTDYTIKSYSNTKNIGKVTVAIEGKGRFLGTTTAIYNINPKKVAKVKAKAGKKKITVTWKKDKQATKYQVRYKLKSAKKWKTKNVSSKKTKLILKKLKAGKKYNVQVRSYKKVSGKNYYSAWSKAKTVKAKK